MSAVTCPHADLIQNLGGGFKRNSTTAVGEKSNAFLADFRGALAGPLLSLAEALRSVTWARLVAEAFPTNRSVRLQSEP